MIIAIVVAALAIGGVVATLVELRRDGYRAIPTDWRRVRQTDREVAAAPRGDL